MTQIVSEFSQGIKKAFNQVLGDNTGYALKQINGVLDSPTR
jgi:hypothetical protein